MSVRVTIEHPRASDRSEVRSLLHASCSSCGEVTDWEASTEEGRRLLADLAAAHIVAVHGGAAEVVV